MGILVPGKLIAAGAEQRMIASMNLDPGESGRGESSPCLRLRAALGGFGPDAHVPAFDLFDVECACFPHEIASLLWP
jgi:hypothetical protein